MAVKLWSSSLVTFLSLHIIVYETAIFALASTPQPTLNHGNTTISSSKSPIPSVTTSEKVSMWPNVTTTPDVDTSSLNDIMTSDSLHLAGRIVLGILFIFSTVFGICGNILVLLAVSLNGSLRQQIPNLWVCNLSVTDLLVSCFSIPILGVYMSIYWPNWPFSPVLCKVSVYVANVCATESVNTLVIIAIDRYFAVIRNKVLMNRRIFYILVVITWIVTAGALSYPFRSSGGVTHEKLNNVTYTVCQRMTGRHLLNRDFRNTSILKISVGFVIIALLIGLYARMGIFIFRMRRTPTEENHNKSIRSRNVKQADRNKVKAVRMMFVVVILFLLCWGPYWVVTFIRVFPLQHDQFVSPEIVLATYALSMLNSSWNPILYALLSNSFRKAYAKLLGRKKIKRFNSSLEGTLNTRVLSRDSIFSNGTTKATSSPSVYALTSMPKQCVTRTNTSSLNDIQSIVVPT